MQGNFKHYCTDTSKQPCRFVLLSPPYDRRMRAEQFAWPAASSNMEAGLSGSVVDPCWYWSHGTRPSFLSASLFPLGGIFFSLVEGSSRSSPWPDSSCGKALKGRTSKISAWSTGLSLFHSDVRREETAPARSPCPVSCPTSNPVSPDLRQFDVLCSSISS